ncbi:O-succinylhomoserine sulfhydrylase [Rhodobacter sp. NTK016B]|uniref:O-succinylhomoserine sulfhydrylase n=1 Tax=Rhodobacter sp. NTK016B TaxID=2759676 RepID=UPI001A8E9D5F|nr:O-succinylhomoserine sulfhydrylase [Rhodobacter sp. NTK016B]MBN8293122.1 O-succinylhomoserine sulfhydrylase [Rhodobacter sp. NTK016B]
MIPNDRLKSRTIAVHGGARRSQYGEMAEAMYLTQGFAYPDAESAEQRFVKAGEDEFIYARYGNPTTAVFEDRIAAIEGTEDAFATASGMAAVSGALTALLKAGDRVVASRALFGSCLYVLEDVLGRFGVTVDFVDGTDAAQWVDALSAPAQVVFLESVSNPTLEVIDLPNVCRLAHQAGALVVVDNAFATPIFSRAVEHGADLVVYSATKHIDGQGRCLGGVICGPRELIRGKIEPYLKHTGGAMSPFNAWVMMNGLTTLELRVRAQAQSAQTIAETMEKHDAVAKVLFPGLPSHPQHALTQATMDGPGTVLAFDLKGGKEAAFAFMNALNVVLISNNLGDARTIATHPATTTHQRLPDEQKKTLGITPGLIRLSVGLEAVEDLLADLDGALSAI